MAKTIALSPDSKSRLRREVLEGIGQATPDQASPAKITLPKQPAAQPAAVAPVATIRPVTKTSPVTKPKPKSKAKPIPTIQSAVVVAPVKVAKVAKKSTTRKSAKKSTTKTVAKKIRKTSVKSKSSVKKAVKLVTPLPPQITPQTTITPLGRPLPESRLVDNIIPAKQTAISRGRDIVTTPVATGKILALPAPQHRLRKLAVAFVGFVAVLLVVATITATIGLYRFGWQDRFSLTIAQTLNLPAGTINGATISLADYISDSQTIAKAVSEQREGIGAPTVGGDDVFNRLASITLILTELRRYDISLSDSDIEADLQAIIGQFQDRQAAVDAINRIYGLSMSDFRDKILRPVKARDLLQKQVTADESLAINQAAKIEAEAVLNLAQDSIVNFSLLAKQYTQDETGVNTGGDLGWVTKGQSELPPEVESIIFGLAASSTHPSLVKSDLGYHIIRVDERSTDPESGAESAHARHIMIKVDVDQYIKSLFDQAEMVRYIR